MSDTPTTPTSISVKRAEEALVRAQQRRNVDRARSAVSEAAYQAQMLDSSLAGVTYRRINEITGVSKSRIDTILRGERQRRAKEAKAAKAAAVRK